jgi:hypothetical protein
VTVVNRWENPGRVLAQVSPQPGASHRKPRRVPKGTAEGQPWFNRPSGTARAVIGLAFNLPHRLLTKAQGCKPAHVTAWDEAPSATPGPLTTEKQKAKIAWERGEKRGQKTEDGHRYRGDGIYTFVDNTPPATSAKSLVP